MNIANLQPSDLPQALLTQQTFAAPTGTENPGSFSAIVSDLLKSTNDEQSQVSVAAGELLTGETSNFHEVSLAVARADISFRFMMEVRDQLVGAYREVMRMQV
jgi:flagellar hook-basal body complex protein FliE